MKAFLRFFSAGFAGMPAFKRLAAASAAVLFAGIFLGCSAQQPVARGERESRRSDEDYNRKIDEDEDRDRVLRDSRRRRGGRDCSSDRDCEDICGDIYDRRRDKQDCEKLSQSQVELLLDVFESLEKPTEASLKDIDLEDFDVLINISIEPLDRIVNRYTRRQAKEVLVWLALDEEAAKVLRKEDKNQDTLEKIFEEINTEVEDALKTELEGGDTFMDLVVDGENEEAAEWIHEFMEEKVCGDDIESASCLQEYCDIAEDMDSRYAEDMVDFEYFEDYLQDIIDEGVNGNKWAKGHRTKGDGETEPYQDKYTTPNPAQKIDIKNNCGGTNTDPDDCEPFRDVDDLEDEWWDSLCAIR